MQTEFNRSPTNRPQLHRYSTGTSTSGGLLLYLKRLGSPDRFYFYHRDRRDPRVERACQIYSIVTTRNETTSQVGWCDRSQVNHPIATGNERQRAVLVFVLLWRRQAKRRHVIGRWRHNYVTSSPGLDQ